MALPTPPVNPSADPTQRRFRGSAKITEYTVSQEKLGEGTFGVVTKAISKRTGRVMALKKILMHNEKDGFPITALREVKLLKMLSHPNILRLEEMVVERQPADDKNRTGKKRATLYMVTPYMDHDLSGMLQNPNIQFNEAQIKCYMQQLLEGLRYLHDSQILHRDMKAANILISNQGVLQIADFGLARHYDGPTPQPGKGNGEAVRDYTSLVVTRWYRPPELLLTLRRYTPAIDLWGVGCVFGEMYEKKPILEGRTDVDQCYKIFALVGSPNDDSMPGWSTLPGCEGQNNWDHKKGDITARFGKRMSKEGLDLFKNLLRLDWRTRINAFDALQHDYFKTQPLAARPEDLPRYEDSHELDAKRRGQEMRHALPPAPAGGTVGMGPDEFTNHGDMHNGHYQNGHGYNDRNSRGYGRDRERGPPGAQPPRYDDRRGPAPPDNGRQPSWRGDRDRGRPPPAMNGHPLPARPPTLPPRPDTQTRPPPGAARRAEPMQDSYVPNYSARERDGSYDRERGGRNSREHSYRDADAPPPRSGYRDADCPGARGTDGYGGGGYAEPRRTRSRSPERDNSRRERLQNRERDFYRR